MSSVVAIHVRDRWGEEDFYGVDLVTLMSGIRGLDWTDGISFTAILADGRVLEHFDATCLTHPADDETLRADLAAIGKQWIARLDDPGYTPMARDDVWPDQRPKAERWVRNEATAEDLDHHRRYAKRRKFTDEEVAQWATANFR